MFRTAFPERSSIFSQKLPNPNFQNRENLQNLKIKDQSPKNYLIYATLTRIVPFFSLQSLLHSQQIFSHFIIIMNIFLFFAQQEKIPENFQRKISHQRPRRFLDTSISTIPLEFPTYIKKQKFLDSDVDTG